jgi:DNA-binding transcriptional ArsR family regulator
LLSIHLVERAFWVRTTTIDSSHKVSGDALAVLFSSSARAVMLRAMLIDPSRAYYQRQLEAATGLPLRAVQRELDRLTKAGLLYRRQEGNRAYYQADTGCPFYADLLGLVLKGSAPVDRLRAALAADPEVRLGILDGAAAKVLVVGVGERRPAAPQDLGFAVERMRSEPFESALHDGEAWLAAYLRDGWDLLGRRDDVIWRRIEEAGYTVAKGKGVP